MPDSRPNHPSVLPRDGILVVDKPSGPTSHDIVARVRQRYQTRQVGHAGTLDPLASGVLVVMLGEATKLSAYLTTDTKRYEATVSFGRSTDTDDVLGRTLASVQLGKHWLDQNRLLHALAVERQRTLQEPPQVSALKYGGTPAHRLHRRGLPVPTTMREISVLGLRLLALDEHELSLELVVSKGYYVRALARDLGIALGVPAHLAALRRTHSGNYSLADAHPWPLPDAPAPPAPLMDVSEAASRCLPSLRLSHMGVERARLGQRIPVSEALDPELLPPVAQSDTPSPYLLQDEAGAAVAIGFRETAELLRVVRGFRLPAQNASSPCDDAIGDNRSVQPPHKHDA